MIIVSRGLAFDYSPTDEAYIENNDLVEPYVVQTIKNFCLVEYQKREGKVTANIENGFVQLNNAIIFRMSAIDGEPRRMVFDWSEQKIYRVETTPLNPIYDPSKRRLIDLKMKLVNSNMLRFDMDFLKAKYLELVESLNGELL